MKGLFYSAMTAILLGGCYSYEETDYTGCHEPITINRADVRQNYPRASIPREIDNAGKIYVYGDLLLVVEKGHGLHVVDNADKQQPRNTGFIEIPGNTDLAVKENSLFVDSFTDLVVLDISNLDNISTVYRKEDIFPYAPNESLSDADREKSHCYGPDDQDQLIVGYE